MTRSPLMLIVGCLAMATPAHGIEINRPALGASSHLTCGQFLALPKEVRDGAEAWAYGYISAWQEVLAALGGMAAAWPLVARAQQPAMPVIAGYLRKACKSGISQVSWCRP